VEVDLSRITGHAWAAIMSLVRKGPCLSRGWSPDRIQTDLDCLDPGHPLGERRTFAGGEPITVCAWRGSGSLIVLGTGEGIPRGKLGAVLEELAHVAPCQRANRGER
jgi:hypothetical protein